MPPEASSREPRLDWNGIASTFRVLSAWDVSSMEVMRRHQDIRPSARWLTQDSEPLALLFISHRWETLDHPDPDGRQLRAIQALLRRIALCMEAMMVARTERLRRVPSLTSEGSLQAQEIARRMLGFGPFGDASPRIEARDARKAISASFRALSGQPGAFRQWLLERIGVWFDYCCMPQRPLAVDELSEFRESLRNLDGLVRCSTVVALRTAGDDYPQRGWCASEFFLGSRGSFARSLFVRCEELEAGTEVALPPPPSVASTADTAVAGVVDESYRQNLAAFQDSIEQWSKAEEPLANTTPPDAWSAYRSLQGSGFFDRDSDPNPFRRVMDAVRGLERSLVENWLMSKETRVIDLGAEVSRAFDSIGLRCSDRLDLVYLGLLLPCQGWVETFRPLFRAGLDRYVNSVSGHTGPRGGEGAAAIPVMLKPVGEDVRALFFEVTPTTAATWVWRLSSHSGRDAREGPVIERLLSALNEHPPVYEFVEADQISTPRSP